MSEVSASKSFLPPKTPALLLRRQPIYNAQFKPLAYELGLHGTRADASASSLFLETFRKVPSEELLGQALAFVHSPMDYTVPEFETIVKPDRVVIDLSLPDENIPVSRIDAQIEQLHQRGFAVALGVYALRSDLQHCLPKADYLKLDTRKINPLILKDLPRRLSKHPSLKLIATHIDQQDMMETMMVESYFGFHGPLPDEPPTKKSGGMETSRQSILMLMQQVQGETEISDIEISLKCDPALSVHLLRFINSAAFALRTEITSLKRAIDLLGRKKLHRWLCMRLAASSTHPAQNLLLRSALARARMMELLATECKPRLSPDEAFVTGIFSMLGKLLGLKLEEVLQKIPLPRIVMQALTYEESMGMLLFSVEACEMPETDIIMSYEDELGIEGLLPVAHLNAIQWAESVVSI